MPLDGSIDDGSPLGEDYAGDLLRGICFKTGPPRKMGVELEWLVHDLNSPEQPVSARRLEDAFEDLRALPLQSALTFEPGGQLELSTAPAPSLMECITSAAADLDAVRPALRTAGLALVGLGQDPWHSPERLLRAPRYDAMETDLARVIRTTALLAAVRDATTPGSDGEAAAAPFAAGPWLFSHNGAVGGWPRSLADVATALPAEELLSLAARNDSALVWALVLHRLREGDELGQALAGTVLDVAAASPASRLNLLLTDGDQIAATAWGDTLWYLNDPGDPSALGHRAVVASEPYDHDPRWREVPDGTLLVATRTDVLLTPLKEPPA